MLWVVSHSRVGWINRTRTTLRMISAFSWKSSPFKLHDAFFDAYAHLKRTRKKGPGFNYMIKLPLLSNFFWPLMRRQGLFHGWDRYISNLSDILWPHWNDNQQERLTQFQKLPNKLIACPPLFNSLRKNFRLPRMVLTILNLFWQTSHQSSFPEVYMVRE